MWGGWWPPWPAPRAERLLRLSVACPAHRPYVISTREPTDLASTPPTKGTTMTLRFGLLAVLEAKPGKGAELGAFLESGRAIAAVEQGTVTWYAFKINDTTYGIFDTFETEDARNAHL